MKLATIAKFVTALTGMAGEIVTLGIAHGQVAHWLTVGIAIATALAVYLVPNKTTV